MRRRLLLILLVILVHVLPRALLSAFPIDLVYTWVDGSDPVWQTARDEWLTRTDPSFNKDSASKNKFRNRDELKYSLRSVLTFAPWFNHIYIVTAGQVPHWLKEHPRVTVVAHKAIFLDTNDLPTFSSMAIEANLHRIPNLSEHYIYLNDDMMFSRPVTPNDFFTDSGKMKPVFRNYYTRKGPLIPGELASHSGWKNTNALLDKYFKVEPRKALAHTAAPMLKSVVEDLESLFPEVFQTSSSLRFRSPANYTLTNGLIQYYGLYTGRALAGNLTYRMAKLNEDFEQALTEFHKLKKQQFHIICIEDVAYADCEDVDFLLQQFLEYNYSLKAPWEK